MEITTLLFSIFVIVTLIFYYILPKKFQWIVLLIASLIFFISSSAFLTIFMLVTTLAIYLGALKIQKITDDFKLKKKTLDKSEWKQLKAVSKKQKKAILTAIVTFVIAVLGVLKYCNLFGEIINSIGSIFSDSNVVPKFTILLPLGISYYTLMSVSYIVDVYRGTIKAEKNPFRLLLFVSYFPHIIEGPFDRYADLDVQFRTEHKFNYEQVIKGFILVLYGLMKKMVIADKLGYLASSIFDSYENFSGTSVAVAVIAYTLQLYCDFSGCIEVVTGVSEMFGIKIAENFKQPFFSRSINEFWRRWHITLGLWLKDYVFYPVSFSKNFKSFNLWCKKHIKNEYFIKMIPAAYALFFVWFCNGLWHGASGKYIFYGLYYYILMMLGEFTKPITDKICIKIGLNRDSKLYIVFQMLRTFIIVNIGMLIFNAATLGTAWNMLISMFKSFAPLELISNSNITNFSNKDIPVLAVCLLIVLIVDILKEKGCQIRTEIMSKPLVLRWGILLFLIFATIIFGVYGDEFGKTVVLYGEF